MDHRVKERLVGASILAALIVLVVPELLSGPAPAPAASRPPVSSAEPVRTVTVDVTTSKAPSAPAADTRGAAPPDGLQDAASSAASAPAPPTSLAHAATAEPLETASPPPKSLPVSDKPAAAGHAWAVQLGSFASRDNADRLSRQLKTQGFSVYVLSGGSGPSLRYRVRIGPVADRDAAAEAVAKLKSLGHAASVVPPGA
jgi:DedD protein